MYFKEAQSYSKEAQLAKKDPTACAEALVRTHRRREGFALARPYSVALLAHGQSGPGVEYSGGNLCYIYQDLVRILDVHGASKTENVIDMKALVAELPEHGPSREIDCIGWVYHYENGILTMKLDSGSVYHINPIMVVIDVRRSFVSPLSPSRIRKILRAPLPTEVFTDGRYLICVHQLHRIDGCVHSAGKALAWTLKCYDLSNPEGSASIIALGEFLPRASDCLFKILGGWLYAICSDEEGRFTPEQHNGKRLYYYCCRFPIDDFGPAGPWKPGDFLDHSPYTPLPARLEAVKLFRGVAEDVWGQNWRDLVQDERTGEVFIVESESKLVPQFDRPYRRLIFPDPPAHTVSSPETKISEVVQTIEEFPCSSDEPVHQFTPYPIRGHENRIHVQPSQSFIDIRYEHGKAGPPRQALHLCAGSRVAGSPIDPLTNLLYKKGALTEPNNYFIDRGMRRFPPQGAPQELREFLTVSEASLVFADERSLIIADPEEDNLGRRHYRIILVNFDSRIHFPGFKPLALESLSDRISYEAQARATKEGLCHGRFDFDELKQTGASATKQLRQFKLDINQQEEVSESSTTTRKAKPPRLNSWFYTRPAMHLQIGQGFQFHRYPPKSNGRKMAIRSR